MGTVGNQDLRSLFAAVAEVGRGNQKRSQLAMRAGRRLKTDSVQPGNLGKVFL